ncbi:MAG: transcription elongation factor, partial [Promethearchaeota archaeon]
MGRRKRKQQTYRRVKRVPKIFTCPECGEKSVKVEGLKKSRIATVKCGKCGLSKEVLVNSISEPVDAFGDFIDIYYADQELQRLEKRIKKLEEEKE